MNYLTYGDETKRTLLFLHGMATTAKLCYEPLLPYLNDYHIVLCEIDGHSESTPNDFVSIKDSCDKLVKYVESELGGKIYGLCAFSMGATLAVELLGRGSVKIQKVLLDAPFAVKIGLLTGLYTALFMHQIKKLQDRGYAQKNLVEMVMGKGNAGILDIIYRGISQTTVKRACHDVYTYELPKQLGKYKGEVTVWSGGNEYYPKKSARLLKTHLPQLSERTFAGMGHGQFLHEHPAEYARELISYF